MVQFFQATPPSVHSMIVKLHELGLVERQPGVARSLRVIVPEDEIPTFKDVEGPPWRSWPPSGGLIGGLPEAMMRRNGSRFREGRQHEGPPGAVYHRR